MISALGNYWIRLPFAYLVTLEKKMNYAVPKALSTYVRFILCSKRRTMNITEL